MEWGAYFLDNPSFGVAVRRLNRLVDAIPRLDRVQLAPILDSLIFGCYGDRLEDKDAYSFLSSDWTPLPLHPRTKTWMRERWSAITADSGDGRSDGEETADSDDGRKLPTRPSSRPAAPQTPPIPSRVRPAPSALGSSPKRARRVPAQTAAALRGRASAPAAAPPAPAAVAALTTALTVSDLGPLFSEILKAQAESTMQLHQSFQTNMMANIQTTSTALAATGLAKDKKLSEAKVTILQACSGHGDLPSFVLSKFYAELDKSGITMDNCGTGGLSSRSRGVPIG
jgi:hypothetical protein